MLGSIRDAGAEDEAAAPSRDTAAQLRNHSEAVTMFAGASAITGRRSVECVIGRETDCGIAAFRPAGRACH